MRRLRSEISDVVAILLGILISLAILIVIILTVASIWFWTDPDVYGSYDLGGGIYALDMSSKSREIVLCTHLDGNSCTAGSPLTQLLIDSKVWYDDEWIVVTGNNGKNQNMFYIINKNGAAPFDKACLRKGVDPKEKENDEKIKEVEKKVSEFRDSVEFKMMCKELGIGLDDLKLLD